MGQDIAHVNAAESLDALVATAYEELRAIAHARLAWRGAGGTLSTTALVHEAYLKLADESPSRWRDHRQYGQWLRCCVPGAEALTSRLQWTQRQVSCSRPAAGDVRAGSRRLRSRRAGRLTGGPSP